MTSSSSSSVKIRISDW